MNKRNVKNKTHTKMKNKNKNESNKNLRDYQVVDVFHHSLVGAAEQGQRHSVLGMKKTKKKTKGSEIKQNTSSL